jgi:hypothetical protein
VQTGKEQGMDNQFPNDPNQPIGGKSPMQPDGGMQMQQPNMGAPLPEEPDVKISNTGQRVAAIVIVVIVVAAAIGVLVFLQGKQKEIEKIEEVKTAFQTAHNKGYVEFWKKVQVDVKSMKTTADFEARIKQVTTDPVRYAKHIKENALPVLDKALPEYKAIVAPPAFQEPLKKVATALEEIRKTWDDFASEYLKLEDYFSTVDKLETASSHWLGWQQKPGTDKFLLNAVRYHKMLTCIFQGKNITDLSYESMESEITNTCAKGDEKAAWFRRFAFECLPFIKSGSLQPGADFEAAVAKAKEEMDTTSKFGVDTCIKRTKEEFESEEIQKLAGPWLAYIKAQNALLDTIDAKLKTLQ